MGTAGSCPPALTQNLTLKPATETCTKHGERRAENPAPGLRRGEMPLSQLQTVKVFHGTRQAQSKVQGKEDLELGAPRLVSIPPRVPASLIRYC